MSKRTDAVAFFYEHGGYGWNPATETPEQGHMRSAFALAKAERWAKRKGMTFHWEDDWTVADHAAEFDCYKDGEPDSCEQVVMLDKRETVRGSLGCVDDATDAYRRVVEAELALEAMP